MPKKKSTPRSRTKQGEIPKIHHRKDRNLAYILLGGTKKYLGHYDGVTTSPEVEAERLRIWGESRVKRGLDPQVVDGTPVTVTILVNRFLEEAKTTYVKHGKLRAVRDRGSPAFRALPGYTSRFFFAILPQGCPRKNGHGRSSPQNRQ